MHVQHRSGKTRSSAVSVIVLRTTYGILGSYQTGLDYKFANGW